MTNITNISDTSITHIIVTTPNKYTHRLLVNGITSKNYEYNEIACNGIYRATTEFYRGILPILFTTNAITKVNTVIEYTP